jgi:nucleoid DNA-binding protein
MTTTKRDLVARVSEDTGMIQNQVMDVIQKTLGHILDALARGEDVELRNFGVFEVKLRKARIGRNPNVPQSVVPIPQRPVVRFKPGKHMRVLVLNVSPDIIISKKNAKKRKPRNQARAAEAPAADKAAKPDSKV